MPSPNYVPISTYWKQLYFQMFRKILRKSACLSKISVRLVEEIIVDRLHAFVCIA